MMDQKRHFGEIKLVAGNANMRLAIKIAEELGLPLENSKVGRFPDGEVKVDLDCVVRALMCLSSSRSRQSHRSPLSDPALLPDASAGGQKKGFVYHQSINDNLVELVMIDAARRASAGRILRWCPTWPMPSRRKEKGP